MGVEPLLFYVLFAIFIFQSIVILRPYERGVTLRLGRLVGEIGPGINFIIPFVDKVTRVSTQEREISINSIQVKDSLGRTGELSILIKFQIINPTDALMNVADYEYALIKLSETCIIEFVRDRRLSGLSQDAKQLEDSVLSKLKDFAMTIGVRVDSITISNFEIR